MIFDLSLAVDVSAWLERGDVWQLRVPGDPRRAILHPQDNGKDDWYVRLDPPERSGWTWVKVSGFLSAQLLGLKLLGEEGL